MAQRYQSHDLLAFLLQAVDIYQENFETEQERGVSLPRQSHAYGSELNQVWTNLIDNAIDAMNGHGQLWIRTSCENNHVLVEIAANGAGIPPEIQSHIFEPFFTTKGVGEGTGLEGVMHF